ncbi:hypothetical protein O181_067917 [Austropuccinia psidii MF-1]|uniref:Uncharacterized protein n=1 Tax=Austropuccinia psidii MF-1 TaxID=1389203 RepID=A0A9Q3EYC7_9BASI|nr:hypothetical protein [Austropuccinia psidii MF-1]
MLKYIHSLNQESENHINKPLSSSSKSHSSSSSESYHYKLLPKSKSPGQKSQESLSDLISTPNTRRKEDSLKEFFFNLIKEYKERKQEESKFEGKTYKVKKMDQQSTSKLPPLPEDTVEGQYEEENGGEDQTVKIQSFIKHIRPENSPISPAPGPRAISTPETEPRINNIPRRAFVSKPNNASPLQQQVLKQERPVAKIKAKDYNLNFNGEEVENFIKKAERIAQIEGETDKDLAIQMAF